MKHECITKDGQERAALYALGALSQFEARAFDVHLREGCPTCDFELSQFNDVVGALATNVDPVAPPAYLRDLLALRIQREAPEAHAPEVSVHRFPVQPPVQSPAKSISSSTTTKTTSNGPQWLPWAIAAAFLLAFAVSFIAWRSVRTTLQAQIDQSRESALTENAQLKEQLAATSNELTQINSVLSQTAFQIIPLKGQEPSPTSSATVFWDTVGNRWVVSAELPPAPEGKVYQLWFVTAQAKISAGLIRPDRNGHGFAVVSFPPDIGPLAAAAITLEPDGGSEQPTTPIYLVGTV